MAKKIYKGEAGVIDTTYIYEYEDYVEYCEINDCEPLSEGSADYWEYVAHMRDEDYHCELRNLECMSQLNTPCVITGHLGLWYGHPKINPVRMPDVVSAIKKCFGSCDDLKVKWHDGIFEVQAMHHDGTNCFEIHRLNQKGINATADWYNGVGDEIKDYMLGKYYHPYM